MDVMEVGAVMKGKRTKRQRLLLLAPPPPLTSPSTSSTELSLSASEEEEDLANCLILLAQGRTPESTSRPEPEAVNGNRGGQSEKFTSRRIVEAKGGFYAYQCKTCNKCFSSFQALGGHRASHKKPKIAEEKRGFGAEHGLELSMNSFMAPAVGATTTMGKVKIHECSICGAEFTSGQALGGHMRRHRPVSSSEPPDVKKERSFLSLDLNLPAPSDDDQELFPFSAKQMVVFSASPLVDCHY